VTADSGFQAGNFTGINWVTGAGIFSGSGDLYLAAASGNNIYINRGSGQTVGVIPAIHVGSGAPSSTGLERAGDLYLNLSLNRLYVFTGSIWQVV
jgi:hypothetical protein